MPKAYMAHFKSVALVHNHASRACTCRAEDEEGPCDPSRAEVHLLPWDPGGEEEPQWHLIHTAGSHHEGDCHRGKLLSSASWASIAFMPHSSALLMSHAPASFGHFSAGVCGNLGFLPM